MQHCSYLGCPLDLCFKNTNNPMWQKGSSRVTGGNWTIGVSSIQPKESSNCFSFRLLLEGVEEECGAISHSFEDFSDYRVFRLETIHLRRRQIFTNFWPLPPYRRQFFSTIRRQIWQIFDPSPPKTCRRLKWMVPKITWFHYFNAHNFCICTFFKVCYERSKYITQLFIILFKTMLK